MKLEFLGTGSGGFRGGRRHTSCVFADCLLFDCGAGATGRLHDRHQFDRVDGVLISHLHTDHVAGLLDLLLHTVLTHRTRPLTILSPPGLGPILRAVTAAGGTVKDPGSCYDLRLIESDRPEVTIGGWTVRGIALDHTVPNLGYLARRDGLSILYTGDTREPSGVHEVTADYLIHESTFSEADRALAHDFGHSTAAQAATAALASKARRLFLTHLGDAVGLEADVAREARGTFPDSVVVNDGDAFDL